MGAYKGVTDLVTKYVWPVPAMWVTRLCVTLRLTPNMVTSIGAILTLLALGLFWEGYYGWGLLAGWVMTFLDTVDGKLARVTVTSSPLGNIFDHGIDLIHPPFWYLGWLLGLTHTGLPDYTSYYSELITAIFGGYIAGRLVEGYFVRRFGFHLHVWRRFDAAFRLILARRNPNLILLTLSWLAGREDLGLLAVAGWTVATLVIHLVQVMQAEYKTAQSGPLASFLTASA